MKIASDYAHKRYRAVCADLTKKERKHLGGTSACMLKIAVLNAFVPINQREQEAPHSRRPRAAGTRRSSRRQLYITGSSWYALSPCMCSSSPRSASSPVRTGVIRSMTRSIAYVKTKA